MKTKIEKQKELLGLLKIIDNEEKFKNEVLKDENITSKNSLFKNLEFHNNFYELAFILRNKVVKEEEGYDAYLSAMFLISDEENEVDVCCKCGQKTSQNKWEWEINATYKHWIIAALIALVENDDYEEDEKW